MLPLKITYELRGYFVPEGATVIANIRYILHNLTVYLKT